MSGNNEATVIINDEKYEAVVGERLIEVARRNGSHIGFVCDGAGWCATCECKVLSGSELLSEETPAEKAWLHPDRLATGYRFTCQTRLEKPGSVKIISRAEILRRQFLASFVPPAGRSPLTYTTRLFRNLATITVQHLEQAPDGMSYSLNKIGKNRSLFRLGNLNAFVQDSSRVINHQLEGEKETITVVSSSAAITPPKIVLKEEPFEDIKLPDPPAPVPVKAIEEVKLPAPVPVKPSKPFDFLPIEDIGPVFNQRLFQYGVYSYEQLAALSPEEIALAVDTSPERIERNQWREQAAKLAVEGK